MKENVYIGIDIGTQGLSVVVCDSSLDVLVTAEGSYQMIDGQPDGHFLQNPNDWVSALSQAMADIHQKIDLKDDQKYSIACIGLSGQMHGEVLVGEDNQVLSPARLWCDSRNEEEEKELTEALGVKMPKRMTSVRWLWTRRNQTDIASKVRRITTPSGYLSFQLTGQWNLGVGDASGMFPINLETMSYDENLLKQYDDTESPISDRPLKELLPEVKVAGEDAGMLNDQGAKILGLSPGISVAPAEGDQPAALAGSLIAKPGMVSLSFGTSVCANSVGEKSFEGVSHAVDHFCAADGRPINMIWLRNGTTYMNRTVELFGAAAGWNRSESFQNLMPKVLSAPEDCEGVVAIPFIEDEPGLKVSRGSCGGFVGLGTEKGNEGSIIRASILATVFNLRIGTQILDDQGFGRTRLILTGGLTRTPELAQLIADCFQNEVVIPDAAEEGTAWGAAVLAKFRHSKQSDSSSTWEQFVQSLQEENGKSFQPSQINNDLYQQMLTRYRQVISVFQES